MDSSIWKKVEFAKLKENEIAQWIKAKVKEYGKTIEAQSIAFFLMLQDIWKITQR